MYERSRSDGANRYRRLYVSNVNKYVRERDLEDLFSRLGRVSNCIIREDYAFIDYEDPRDASDAIKEYDGYRLEGDRIRVEYARKGPPQTQRRQRSSVERCYNCGDTGHFARECTIPIGRGDRAMRFDENRCFDCGSSGHLARDCPEKRNGRRSSRDRGPSRSPRRYLSRSRTPPRRERGLSRSRSPRRSSRSSKRESDDERERKY